MAAGVALILSAVIDFSIGKLSYRLSIRPTGKPCSIGFGLAGGLMLKGLPGLSALLYLHPS